MKIIVEIELDETWTPGEDEQINPTDIIKHAITLSEGVKSRLIYATGQNDKEYDRIESLVCDYTGVDTNEIKLKTRKREIVEAKQICHYISRKKGLGSLSSIGFRFGRMDHASVLHSNRIITTLLQTDKSFKNQYQSFIESFFNHDTTNSNLAKD